MDWIYLTQYRDHAYNLYYVQVTTVDYVILLPVVTGLVRGCWKRVSGAKPSSSPSGISVPGKGNNATGKEAKDSGNEVLVPSLCFVT
jgi:hypothetical protein